MTIETSSINLARTSGNSTVIVNFSSTQDPKWAGVISLPPYARLPLEANVRNDIYVLRGQLTERAIQHSSHTFLSRFTVAELYAGSQGALLFMYRDCVTTLPQPAIEKTITDSKLKWHAGGAEGMQVAPLLEGQQRLMLVSWLPGVRMNAHAHPFGEEIFVLEGALRDEYGCHVAGTWQRLHPGTVHAPYAEIKTRILLRNGHLGHLGHLRI